MTATNHTVSGAVIGAFITNPFLALPLAFFSHFLLDMVPHYELGKHHTKSFVYKLLVDMAMASSFLLALLIMQPSGWERMFACSILAASPDLLWFPYWVQELQGKTVHYNKLAKKLVDIQKYERDWGIFVEVPFLIVNLLLFFGQIY